MLGRVSGGPLPEQFHPPAGVCITCDKSHCRHKAGGKVSSHIFWPWGRQRGGCCGAEFPLVGSGLLGCFTGCDFPPPTVFRATPQGSDADGDGRHKAVTILICWGTVGGGCASTCPQARGDGKPQTRAQGAGMEVIGGWYGVCWGLVHGGLTRIWYGMGVTGNGYGGYWGLLQGVTGLLHPHRAAVGPRVWVSLGWFWWKKGCLKMSPAIGAHSQAAGAVRGVPRAIPPLSSS